MSLSLNIGNFFNDSASHALVDELRKKTTVNEILEFEEKFNSKKNLTPETKKTYMYTYVGF